jgi:hypothetical protein
MQRVKLEQIYYEKLLSEKVTMTHENQSESMPSRKRDLAEKSKYELEKKVVSIH